MCGEIDEQAAVGQDLLEQMQAMAKMLGVKPEHQDGGAPENLDAPEGRAAYMDAVFRDQMARAVADIAMAEEDEAVDALASHAIALARLAGFLAGQLPPEADLYRALIEAVSAGHAEPREIAERQRRARGHHHDHHHHHDHSHDHSNTCSHGPGSDRHRH